MDKGMVLYLSHIANKATRNYGYGIQGYVFDNIVGKKGSGCQTDYLSDIGYFSKSQTAGLPDDDDTDDTAIPVKASDDEDAVPPQVMVKEPLPSKANPKVQILNYVEIASGGQDIRTRYHCELLIMIEVFNRLILAIEKDPEINTVILYTDTRMCLKIIQNQVELKENEYRRNGQTIQQKELTQVMLSLYNRLNEMLIGDNKKFKVTLSGDSVVNQGIIHAKAFASLAIFDTQNYCDRIVAPDGYWKNAAEPHPLTKNTYQFFRSNAARNPGEMFMGGGIDPYRIGHRAPDVTFSYIKLNTPIETVERIIEVINAEVEEDDRIMYFNMNEFSKPRNSKIMLGFPRPFVKAHAWKLDYTIPPDSGVVYEKYPPGPAWRAFDELEGLKAIHEKFIGGELPENYQSFDITEVFYALDEKKKLRLKPEHTAQAKDVDINVTFKGTPVRIPVRLGIDAPFRNSLKKMEKNEPKLILICYEEEQGFLRYVTLMQTNEGSGVYAGPYSNLFISRLVLTHEYN